jgi:hypothetical protein
MIVRHLHSGNSENSTARRHPKAINSDKEKKFIQFCLVRQSEKNQVTAEDAMDFMQDDRVQVERFLVRRFVEPNSETLALQQARILDKGRHEISEDDLNRYFDVVTIQLQNVPSLFIWNADETRVGISKKRVASDVIVANSSKNYDNR